MILAVVVGAVDVTGCAVLHADHLVICKIVNSENVGILRYDDDLDAGCVGLCEVYVLLALFSNRKTCHRDIGLAALYGCDDRTELHVVNDQLKAELVCNLSSDLNVDAFEAAVVRDHLIGRECSVGSHVENAFLNCCDCSGLFACLGGRLCFRGPFLSDFSFGLSLSLSRRCGCGAAAAASC